ncbi:MAG: hypothetical protein LM590_08580, partial [Thermofilum sp.]|nr:hypothetical protein [Thermofilum sp.]
MARGSSDPCSMFCPWRRAHGYNFTKGYQIIQEEMTKLNATLNYGKWWYNGSPVIIKFLIRSEDSRKQIGDYVADQLEKLGF